ncbi:MAG: response regulator, partial [Armatimonadota bacterium]|nr:response regulator [Armatimonadota bacterium]
MATENKIIRVLVADGVREARERLRDILADVENAELVGLARDGQEAAQMALQLRPDIMLVNENLSVLDGLRVCETVSLGAPEVRTVLIGDGEAHNSKLMRQALRCGARAILNEPLEPDEVVETILDLSALDDYRSTDEYQAVADATKAPKVVVVTGAKGGIGKSTIATNLAVGLAKQTGDRVVLVDLYTQYGDVASMMNIVPTRTIIDLIPMSSEIDI